MARSASAVQAGPRGVEECGGDAMMLHILEKIGIVLTIGGLLSVATGMIIFLSILTFQTWGKP